jgi:hypothetical protein
MHGETVKFTSTTKISHFVVIKLECQSGKADEFRRLCTMVTTDWTESRSLCGRDWFVTYCIDKLQAHICALLFRKALPLQVWCARL